MPEAAIEAVGGADYSAPLSDLAALLVALSHTTVPEPGFFPVPADVAVEDEIGRGRPSNCRVAGLLGNPSAFSCPACGGVLSELTASPLRRYRCPVGHAYSAVHLFAAQRSALPPTLWSAVVALREEAQLARLLHREKELVEGVDPSSPLLETALRAEALSSRLLGMIRSAAAKGEDVSAEGRAEPVLEPAAEPSSEQPV
jgi:hypothetical protein